jgi:hypothetical protein
MSRSEAPTRGPARVLPYLISGILIAIGIILPLTVPIYARADPTLAGIPFFYWYQMLWVFIDAMLLWIVYVIITREDRRRRAVASQLRGNGAANELGEAK